MKDNDFGPPKETVPPTSSTDVTGGDDDDDDNNIGDEEPTSVRSDGDGSSSKGDAIIGSIRFVSCSVAGSDPLDNPKENDEGKIHWFVLFGVHFSLSLTFICRFGAYMFAFSGP